MQRDNSMNTSFRKMSNVIIDDDCLNYISYINIQIVRINILDENVTS